MLVHFSCPETSRITMFGDVALELIGMMGHSGTVPGAIRGDNLKPALERLRAKLAAVAAQGSADADDDDDGPVVTLSQRALPLIEMLQAAIEAESYVMWE
ncbi:MAG: DUF1840 domain-containing protein [Xanthomonadales bacterium]|nr:DUF1840 domain-containing protein [Xanthomonadales bacterium]